MNMMEVNLSDLIEGDVVRVLADQAVDALGDGDAEVDNTTEYYFEVLEIGVQPRCNFSQRIRGGNSWAGPARVRLLGSGEDVPVSGEAVHKRELRLEEIESTQPCPISDGILRAGRTILILDDRDAELPGGKGWHELAPEIVALTVSREALPVEVQ